MGRQGFFTAEQLASRFDLATPTIEEYADRGLLHPVDLPEGRLYTASAFTLLAVIQKGKNLGFSLAEIKLIIENVRRPH